MSRNVFGGSVRNMFEGLSSYRFCQDMSGSVLMSVSECVGEELLSYLIQIICYAVTDHHLIQTCIRLNNT